MKAKKKLQELFDYTDQDQRNLATTKASIVTDVIPIDTGMIGGDVLPFFAGTFVGCCFSSVCVFTPFIGQGL